MTYRQEMAKAYEHEQVEERIYAFWEEGGYFVPRGLGQGEPFVITMPPPNVTGALHLGHAMTAALEDLVTRWHRMRGEPTLWLPGVDHAGIATQNVVERELAKEGLTRHDLGRERFVERVWDWVRAYRARITDQHKRLGVSCDWARERFTLEDDLSHAVRTAFVRLFEKGLIYRGSYLINWCPRCLTAISDLEVEHEDHAAKLWYIRYPVLGAGWSGPGDWGSGRWAEGAQDYIVVATTRPETLLGDTAVAVHPQDERFGRLVGRQAVLPGVSRPIPILADEAVDPAFGTGAVKVTPAHDPTDYEIGRRHELPAVDILYDDARINENGGPYEGLDRYECRRRIVEDLEREGLLVRITEHAHALGHCQRCHTVVEPRISTQWFVRIQPLAQAALEAVRDGPIRIVPERFVKIYFNWLENIRDWCISRQLWWGHRIPVWYCDDCGGQTCTVEDPTACAHCGGGKLHQDEDVLDTWFSSGLWPFSTLGWPRETDDFRNFYPTTMRETGYDILFFWVAREIMMGLEMTGRAPYEVVYLHGLIRNEHGQKISKSMPDADRYDPLHIIRDYGADALRFTLVTSSTPGNDMNLDLRRIEGARNFANKIWNATRFVVSNLQLEAQGAGEPGALELPERWIRSRYQRLLGEVNDLLAGDQYGEAGRRLYDFLWSEFCDWYVEISKLRLYGADEGRALAAREVLLEVLEGGLRLLHPLMPFVTEELWQYLTAAPYAAGRGYGPALIVAPYPQSAAAALDPQAESAMALLMELIREVRNARAERGVEPGRWIEAVLVAGRHSAMLREQAEVLGRLARVDADKLRIEEHLAERPQQVVTLVVGEVECLLPLAGLVDLEAERKRLQSELERTGQEIEHFERKLANQQFLTKAPAEVVQKERDRLALAQEERRRLRARLGELG
ncbi:MAG: valine--tRNA ligase [Chloroflexia bacterium]|nr:valine--tRNA ligase [Chloroflexia bacterium]